MTINYQNSIGKDRTEHTWVRRELTVLGVWLQ